jgi:acyl carrier protein
MMAVTSQTVRQTLREHILSNYLFTDEAAALKDDDSFQETRHIDSMGMMQLIQFIEGEYGIRIGENDLVPEKLDSVSRLVALILQKTGSETE